MDNKKKNPNVPNLRFNSNSTLKKVRLSNCCEIIGGYAFDSKKMSTKEGTFQVIKMGNVYNGILDLSRNTSYISNPTNNELVSLLKEKDIIITLTGTVNKKDYGYSVQIENQKNLLLNQRCALIRATNINDEYLFYLIKSKHFLDQFYSSSTGGTGNQTNVSIKAMEQFKVSIHSEEEQEKIAYLLKKIDIRISTQIKIIEDFELLKKEISNRIFSKLHLFPTGIIEEYIHYEQPQKYIVKSTEYVEKNEYTVPVLTANQAFILGYTNEIDGIYNKGSCIIFDDFTLDCKYVDFDFKIKSSAIKILKGNNTILIKYFYEYFKFLNLSTEEHKRHYISEISKLPINVPSILQQSLIVNQLDLFSKKIEIEKAILNLFKEQKNYLLSNMFI